MGKIEIGIFGKAYDGPDKCRAYTYKHQPDNLGAYQLGRASLEFDQDKSPCGDFIDRGLKLLRHLEKHGFGVFETGKPAQTTGKGGE